MNNDEPVMDYEEMITYVAETTGYTKETVQHVLDVETEYMISVGIISTEE